MRYDLKAASMEANNALVAHSPGATVLSEEKTDVDEIRQNSKKRKNDYVLFDPEMENPNEKAALKSDDVFFDMKPRWRRAFMQELHRQESAKEMTAVVLLCPDEQCKPPEDLIDDSDLAEKSHTNGHVLPKSPTFRQATRNGGGQSGSPSGVDAFERGRVYFWERSLAWSEDGDDTVPSHRDQQDIRLHLSVPEKLGREFANSKLAGKSLRELATGRKLNRNRLATTKMFREADVDKVTQIHWEEKVLDGIDLEKMAKLSISGP
jgi:hypothetical protein